MLRGMTLLLVVLTSKTWTGMGRHCWHMLLAKAECARSKVGLTSYVAT